ncbi:MAG: hypothetical protein WCT08_05050 [Patescibacteria group bacterium]|jgi:hypothetical protein
MLSNPLEDAAQFTGGQIAAFIKKAGGSDIVRAVLNDEKEITINDKTRAIFDRNGRCIPRNIKSPICDADRACYLQQPLIIYGDRLDRLIQAFPSGTTFCSVEEFRREVALLYRLIEADLRFKNVFQGVWLPLVLPKVGNDDYGVLMEMVFLSTAERSLRKEFPQRSFENHLKGDLVDEVVIRHPSHERLVAKMQLGPVPGIFLPISLQGFSVDAAREFANSLPEIVHLAGGYDVATAITAYPDVLARDVYTPGNDMSAIQWKFDDTSIRFAVCNVAKHEFTGRGFDASSQLSAGLFICR